MYPNIPNETQESLAKIASALEDLKRAFPEKNKDLSVSNMIAVVSCVLFALDLLLDHFPMIKEIFRMLFG